MLTAVGVGVIGGVGFGLVAAGVALGCEPPVRLERLGQPDGMANRSPRKHQAADCHTGRQPGLVDHRLVRRGPAEPRRRSSRERPTPWRWLRRKGQGWRVSTRPECAGRVRACAARTSRQDRSEGSCRQQRRQQPAGTRTAGSGQTRTVVRGREHGQTTSDGPHRACKRGVTRTRRACR